MESRLIRYAIRAVIVQPPLGSARPADEVHMGIGIALQDESGGQLELVTDPKNFLGRLLPDHGDPAHPMLSSIDFYGDTVFNIGVATATAN